MSFNTTLRDLQFRFEYGILRLVVAVVRIFPMEIAASGSAMAWRFLAPRLNPKRHQRALDNLAIAFPEKSETERAKICDAHWDNLGRVMAETMQLDRFLDQPDRITIKSKTMFERYRYKLGTAVG
ncbi:MAG: lipid A biosynthesis acyltransferase, partial [Pseudomonadota bacterium]